VILSQGSDNCNKFNGLNKILTLSNPIFCQPHTPQLLFVLGGKEFGGLLEIIL
jgi:hypothetical protein